MASKTPHVQIRRITKVPPPKTAPGCWSTEFGRGGCRSSAHTWQMLTLLTATKDVDISEAAVLAELVIR
jgi:hypothetical protein